VPSVLIVDDENTHREGLQQALAENYDVTVASNADEALNLMDTQPFDGSSRTCACPENRGAEDHRQGARAAEPAGRAHDDRLRQHRDGRRGDRSAARSIFPHEAGQHRAARSAHPARTENEDARSRSGQQLHERLDEKFRIEGIIGTSGRRSGRDRQDETRRAVARDDPDRGASRAPARN